MSVLDYQAKSFEKIPTIIFESAELGAAKVAQEIATLIREKEQDNQPAVLGLATGTTPIELYDELVRLYKEEGLSFKNVVAFNLDEYYPMPPESPQSYYNFMHQHLFRHIDIPEENIYLLDGSVPLEKLDAYCRAYDIKIHQYGGIDLQILGIGRTGHIGFNEPGSSVKTRTRIVKLSPQTIYDATDDFIKEEFVPIRAITMGLDTILKARRIILMAWGERKSDVIKEAIEGPVTEAVPASFLQNHANTEVYVEKWAASKLTAVKCPWLVGICKWDQQLTKRAVVWLSQLLNKPILKLTDEDYRDNDLGDLLIYYGNSYDLNIKIFDSIKNTITGWPGGKPNSDDKNRPERAFPAKKRVVIFSPHPDDDVISMGGTFLRLVEQGHDVHIAYQTSGNIAVHDDDARRFADFVFDFNRSIGTETDDMQALHQQIVEAIQVKKPGDTDVAIVRTIKGLIRKGEATAACRYFGVKEENIHFLNLPFYETGSVEKKPIGEEDVIIVHDLLETIKPHQVYAAGDLRDPHGTHKVCLDAVFAALDRLKTSDWIKDCYLWLYRGAWHEWDIEEIEMAVPISPVELMKKRRAIFKHQSQKDSPVFPGTDKREFWQRAEDRNHVTAKLFDQLGMTEYEAIEAFVRYRFL